MTFSADLRTATETDRHRLLSAPIIADCLAGRVSRDSYRAFLTEAYHHVKHTVPLLMACGARLPERLEWLRRGVAEYIEEEYGHEQWILADLAAAGFDAIAARDARRLRPRPSSWSATRTTRCSAVTRSGSSAWCSCSKGRAPRSRRAPPRSSPRGSSSRGARARTYCRTARLDTKHVGHFDALSTSSTRPPIARPCCMPHACSTDLYGDVFRALPRAEITDTHTDTRVAA